MELFSSYSKYEKHVQYNIFINNNSKNLTFILKFIRNLFTNTLIQKQFFHVKRISQFYLFFQYFEDLNMKNVSINRIKQIFTIFFIFSIFYHNT